jgi:hypothetical protein
MAIGSGARGTAGQQQDRRNAADRAGNSRGTMGQQQDRRNYTGAQRVGLAAPGVERQFNPHDPIRGTPPTNMRRTANPTPAYDLTPHNVWEALKFAGTIMGGPTSMLKAGIGAMLGNSPMPEFEGYQGQVQGPGDYDGTNRFVGLGARMNKRAGRGLQRMY